MMTTSPRSPASPGALGDSIMERDRLCAQIWKLARAGHIPHIDPDEVPSMIGSPSSHLASELDAARSAAKLDDAAFDGITAGCADEYRKFKARASKTASKGGKRRKLGLNPAKAGTKAGPLNPRKKGHVGGTEGEAPKSPPRSSGRRRPAASPGDGRPGDRPGEDPAGSSSQQPGSVTPDAEPAEPLFERTLVVSGKRKRAASAKARSLTLDDLVEEDDDEEEDEEKASSDGGTTGGTAGRPTVGRKTLKKKAGRVPPSSPTGRVKQWTSLVSIEEEEWTPGGGGAGGRPSSAKKGSRRKPKGGASGSPSRAAAAARKAAYAASRCGSTKPNRTAPSRTSKLSGGFSVGPDGRPRKGPLLPPSHGDHDARSEWDGVERGLVGFAWIERGRYGKYRSRISLDGRKVELGCYDLASDAALAYDLGAVRFGLVEGRGAELNFGENGGGGAGHYDACRALEERAFGLEVDGARVRELIDAKVAGAK